MKLVNLSRIRQAINHLYYKHLLATNVVTCGTLLGVGDFIVQKSSNLCYGDKNCTNKYDYARTGRMVVIGLILGPFNHYWYTYLDKLVTGYGIRVVLKKVACDQLVAGPFFCTSFLVGMTIMEGAGIQGAVDECKDKFLTIYMADWSFWPAAQFINFKFIPSRYRVLYVSFATLLWNTFLSYIKHEATQFEEKSKSNKAKTLSLPQNYRSGDL